MDDVGILYVDAVDERLIEVDYVECVDEGVIDIGDVELCRWMADSHRGC